MDSIQTGCPSSKCARFFCKRATGAFVAALVLTAPMPSAAAAGGRAVVLDIDGVIGPAFSDYIKRELVNARTNETRLIVFRINTPGGHDTSMREIRFARFSSTRIKSRHHHTAFLCGAGLAHRWQECDCCC